MNDYGYLVPNLNKIEMMTVTEDMVMSVNQETVKRLIFEDVEFDSREKQKIKELRKFFEKEGCDNYSDVLLLKFLYLAKFDFKECLRRVAIYEEWRHNPLIQGGNPKGLSILKEGILYSYGRDYEFRPIIIYRIWMVDLKQHSISDHFWALNKLMEPIQSAMMVPGKVEKVVIIIDNGGKSFILPMISDYRRIISKVATAYMHRAERIVLINATCLINLLYTSSKSQLQEQTSTIMLLSTSNLHLLQQFISPRELEQKYGGNAPNLSKYWPIQVTDLHIMQRRKAMKRDYGDVDEPSFESLDNQERNFQIHTPQSKGCCQCRLF